MFIFNFLFPKKRRIDVFYSVDGFSRTWLKYSSVICVCKQDLNANFGSRMKREVEEEFHGREAVQTMNRWEFCCSVLGSLFVGCQDLASVVRPFQIVLLGNQSAGKSSVVYSLTNIRPYIQDARLATRCPVQYQFIPVLSDDQTRVCVMVDGYPNLTRNFPYKASTLNADLPDHLIYCMNEITGGDPYKISTDRIIRVIIYSVGSLSYSLIDVPGLIGAAPFLDRRQEKELVDSTMEIHLRHANNDDILNVIVADCRDDPWNNRIVPLRRDPESSGLKSNTIVLFTKADIAARSEIQRMISDYMTVDDNFLLLRNRTPDETDQCIRKGEREEKARQFYDDLVARYEHIGFNPGIVERQCDVTALDKRFHEYLHDKIEGDFIPLLNRLTQHMIRNFESFQAITNVFSSENGRPKSIRELVVEGVNPRAFLERNVNIASVMHLAHHWLDRCQVQIHDCIHFGNADVQQRLCSMVDISNSPISLRKVVEDASPVAIRCFLSALQGQLGVDARDSSLSANVELIFQSIGNDYIDLMRQYLDNLKNEKIRDLKTLLEQFFDDDPVLSYVPKNFRDFCIRKYSDHCSIQFGQAKISIGGMRDRIVNIAKYPRDETDLWLTLLRHLWNPHSSVPQSSLEERIAFCNNSPNPNPSPVNAAILFVNHELNDVQSRIMESFTPVLEDLTRSIEGFRLVPEERDLVQFRDSSSWTDFFRKVTEIRHIRALFRLLEP